MSAGAEQPAAGANATGDGRGSNGGGVGGTTELGPEVRGESWLGWLESGWTALDQWVERGLPAALNPLAQLGAVANTCLLLAVASGIALLLWYTPSVHRAYQSLEAIRVAGGIGQWVRSVHRYSSDGCVFFILLHAVRIASQRRFVGARWTAWVTGLLMLAAVWAVGWTGYWLVWDVRAQHAALGTARFIDELPLFAEPLSRSFLTDASVPSLLFFLVFFAHMLVPLSIGVGLWLHLMRVSRARLITARPMTMAVGLTLSVLSVIAPATSAVPARMAEKSAGFSHDAWYLWPLAVTDRLGGGALWALFLGGGLAALSVPWWMTKRRRSSGWKAGVDLPRCFGCTLCSQDCPFNAITMVVRDDGRKFAAQSHVDADLCVGCGVCAGSCDSMAINLPAFHTRDRESVLSTWIDVEVARGGSPVVVFACGDAELARAGEGGGDPGGGWMGCRVERVPCLGWISAVLLERLLNRGAVGILAVKCGGSDPTARDGCRWFEERLAGRREPAFDRTRADVHRVRVWREGDGGGGAIQQAIDDLRAYGSHRAAEEGATPAVAPSEPAGRVRKWVTGLGVAAVLGAVMWGGSVLPHRTALSDAPELVVSFNHLGAIAAPRKLTPAEMADRLPHMRAQVNVTRERMPVGLRVSLDGRVIHERTYRARGLARDGQSVAIVRFEVSPGVHTVRVELADGAEPGAWNLQWEAPVRFEASTRRVVLYDTKTGFTGAGAD